jgi:hypothetical protein
VVGRALDLTEVMAAPSSEEHAARELPMVLPKPAQGLGNELAVGFREGGLIPGKGLGHFKTTETNWHI